MLCLCATQLRFWFQTDLGRENSASYYRQGKQLLLTLLTTVTLWSSSTSNFHALIGQNLTGEFMRKIYTAAIRSLLFFMASWFMVEKYVTCQSRKSDFGWHRYRFLPCLIRKGWKVWSDTGLTWYLSGAASWMVSLSNYCIWCLFFRSNLMKSSVVYAAI